MYQNFNHNQTPTTHEKSLLFRIFPYRVKSNGSISQLTHKEFSTSQKDVLFLYTCKTIIHTQGQFFIERIIQI